MERTPVTSGLIASIGYDEPTKTLEVEIITHRPKNVVYTYSPFSPQRFAEFQAAESKGKYFLRNIKPDAELNYKRMGDVDATPEKKKDAAPSETETTS